MRYETNQECNFTTEQEFKLEKNLRDENKIPMLLSTISHYLYFIDANELDGKTPPKSIDEIKEMNINFADELMSKHNVQLFQQEVNISNFPIAKERIRDVLSRSRMKGN